MQILDVNSNLLKMLSVQEAQKTSAHAENESFADVLNLTDGGVASVSDTQSTEEKNVAYKPNKRESKPLDKEVASREDNIAKDDKVSKKENHKTNNKKDNSQKTSKNDSAENTTPQEQNKPAKNVVAEEQNNIQNPIRSESVEAPIASQVVLNGVVDVSSLFVVNSDSQVAQPVVVNTDISDELVVISDAEVDTSGIVQNVVENNSSAQKIATTTLQNTPVDMSAEQINYDDIAPASDVAQQEEKIAELLPEGESVEIKVSIKEDKVVAAPKKAEVLAEVVALQDTDSELEVSVDTVDTISVGNKKQEVTSNFVAPVTQVEDRAEVISFASTDGDVSAYTPKDASVQAQAITSVVNDKVVKNTTEVDSFKDIYNKGITKEVSEQIKVNITQSAIKGVDKIEIQLKPADLGQVEIKLHIGKGGHLQAQIVASNPETLEILQKDFESLKNAFNSAGYQTDDNSFSFSYQGEDQSNNEREKLRDFIGDVISQDIAVEMAANEYISSDSVNIRV